MFLVAPPPGWPLERAASWRRVRRARWIVTAFMLPTMWVLVLVGFRRGISWPDVFLFTGVMLGARRLGAATARAVDARYPLLPAVDPPPEPRPPLKPSFWRALVVVVLGIAGWSLVAMVVRIALIPLAASPGIVVGAWAAFLSLAAWSLLRLFVAHCRGETVAGRP